MQSTKTEDVAAPLAALLPPLIALLLLSGCNTAALARLWPASDPRLAQAPMNAEARAETRAYFAKPGPKALAFSPETGNNRYVWGTAAASSEDAVQLALDHCEERTGTRCELFAVNNEIVWQPPPGAGTGAAAADIDTGLVARGSAEAGLPMASRPAVARMVTAPPPPISAPAVGNGRFVIHVASVRDPVEVPDEWRRLAKRHPSLAGLALQPPQPIDVPGRGVFYRILLGAFATRAEAQSACTSAQAGGGYCAVVTP